MLQVNITLPTQQHNGTSNQSAIESIKQSIAQQYGGYSAMPVTGGWYDDVSGKLYEDQSILVYTFVDGDKQAEEIKQAAQCWAVDLQQIELLVTVSPVNVHFIQGTRAQAV